MTTMADIKHETSLPTVIADHDGLITDVNQRFEETYGWKAAEIVGKPLTTIIPPNLHAAHHLGFSRFLTTGTPTLLNRPLHLKVQTKSGHILNAEHMIVAEKNSQGEWVFAATIRPL